MRFKSHHARINPPHGAGLVFGILATLSVCAITAEADTILTGKIIDAVTDAPVAGATLEIKRGNTSLSTARSDDAGRFQLPFDVGSNPSPIHLTLLAAHGEYLGESLVASVIAGDLDSDFYALSVMPKTLAGCVLKQAHRVVVGRFVAPTSGAGPLTGLSTRIKDALDYDLVTRLQKLRIELPDRPTFYECEEAQPRSGSLLANYARALHADVLLSGYVRPTDNTSSKYRVDALLGDRFGVYEQPFRASSEAVDLDVPFSAELHPTTHAAVLIALAAGYEEAGRQADCVMVTFAAQEMMGELTPEISTVRERCQRALPNAALQRGNGQ